MEVIAAPTTYTEVIEQPVFVEGGEVFAAPTYIEGAPVATAYTEVIGAAPIYTGQIISSVQATTPMAMRVGGESGAALYSALSAERDAGLVGLLGPAGFTEVISPGIVSAPTVVSSPTVVSAG